MHYSHSVNLLKEKVWEMGLCLKGHCLARSRLLVLGEQGKYKASFGKMTLASGLAKQLIPKSYSANSQKEIKLIYTERNIVQLARFGVSSSTLGRLLATPLPHLPSIGNTVPYFEHLRKLQHRNHIDSAVSDSNPWNITLR